MDRGGAKLLVVSAVSTVALTAGAVTFFVAHPEGRRMFNDFLEAAAGNAPPPKPQPADSAPAPVTIGPVSIESPPKRPEVNPEALEFLKKARQAIAANDLDAAEVAARAALARTPDLKEAAELLETIPALRAQSEAARKAAAHDAALEMARRFLAGEELEVAETWGRKALDQIPESPKALAFLTDVARARERHVKEEAAKRARADDLAREGSQAFAAGEYARAIKLADAALALDVGNAAATLLKDQARLAEKRLADEAAAKAAEKPAAAPAPEPGPISIDAAPQPIRLDPATAAAADAPPQPISINVPPGGMTKDAQALIVALARLDKSFETEDVNMLDRLLSANYVGVQTGTGRLTRDDEIANAREFFRIASAVKLTRTTYEKDVQVTKGEARVRSNARIAYALQGVQLARSYKAVYGFVREGTEWRINAMLVEEEGP
jgi:hypothetical protein